MGAYDSSGSPPKRESKPKGLVALSFASSENEPNPCNARLARDTRYIVNTEKEEVVTVVQWEIARALKSVPITHIVEKHRQEGAYLDSDEVMAQAAEVFRERGVTEVIPVANPFLHLTKCRALIRKEGFVPVKRKIGRIGFYRESSAWWCRGPFHLLLYAVLQKLMGRRGR